MLNINLSNEHKLAALPPPDLRHFPDTPLPDGWLLNDDARLLYTLASQVPAGGAVLELGSWIGRSTCAIALGLRDGGKNVRFDVIDYGIAGEHEWDWRFPNSPVSAQSSAEAIRSVIDTVGGSAALLKHNLSTRGLSQYVSMIVLGDITHYQPAQKYDLIFCDASHSLDEIRRNVPILSDMGKESFTLICDDIYSDENLHAAAKLCRATSVFRMRAIDACSNVAVFHR